MSLGLILLILGGSVALAIGALALMRRRPDGWWRDAGRAGGVLGAARSPFAVIMAFVIFVAFQGFNDARKSAEEEAASTRTVFKTADLLGISARQQLQADELCYARGVIALDWPAMRRGASSMRVDDVAGSVEDSLQAIRVTDDTERAALSEIVGEANATERARSDRVAEAKDDIPAPVWIVLALGALGVLAYVLLFADPREPFVSQAVMVGSVTVIVIGGLLLISFLSHPFRDQLGSIRPDAMKRALSEMQRDPTFAEGGLPVRCDPEGRALPA